MFLKLLMPYYNRMITGGSILKWHKAEREWVAFGEDLFDLHVEEVQVTQLLPLDVAKQIEILVYAQTAARAVAEHGVTHTCATPPSDSQMSDFSMRVTSSDHGILRKIYAKEGDRRRIGDLLALLSTEENEPIEEDDHAIAGASLFRVVMNMS
jgi:hypothetical protein